jgi:hypothetical protein
LIFSSTMTIIRMLEYTICSEYSKYIVTDLW